MPLAASLAYRTPRTPSRCGIWEVAPGRCRGISRNLILSSCCPDLTCINNDYLCFGDACESRAESPPLLSMQMPRKSDCLRPVAAVLHAQDGFLECTQIAEMSHKLSSSRPFCDPSISTETSPPIARSALLCSRKIAVHTFRCGAVGSMAPSCRQEGIQITFCAAAERICTAILREHNNADRGNRRRSLG